MHLEVNNGWLVNAGFTHAESASNMLAYTIFKLRILEISRLIFQISPCKPNIEKKFLGYSGLQKLQNLYCILRISHSGFYQITGNLIGHQGTSSTFLSLKHRQIFQ